MFFRLKLKILIENWEKVIGKRDKNVADTVEVKFG